MADIDEIPPFDPSTLTWYDRQNLFGNLFHGIVIPDSSAVFFDMNPETERKEIKGSDITVRGSDQPHQIIYGQVRVGGVITFITTDVPGGGEWLHMVTTIAGHKCKALLGLYADGVLVPFGTSGGNIYGWSTGDWSLGITGYINVSFSSGAEDQVANAELVSQSSALFPGIWTSNHRQRGLAHVYNILYFSQAKFQKLPDLQFLVQGKTDIYDPRSGGSYVYTNNAALCIADFLSNTKFGLGAVYGTDIDVTNLAEAADTCAEAIGIVGGGTEARYTMDGVIDSSEEPLQILQKMQTTIGGPIVYQGGKWKMYPAKYRTPTITLHEGDFINGIKVVTQESRRDLFNAVKGTYLNATSWQIEDFPPVTNAMYQAEDGERIYFDVTFPFTTSSAKAQRMAKLLLEKARQAFRVTGICTLKAFQAFTGGNIYLTASRLGWTAKPFEVEDWKLVHKENVLAIELSLKETSSGIFEWANGTETVVDLAPNTTLPSPSYVSEPSGLTLESGTEHLFKREDGTVFTRVRVSWNTIVDPFVRNGGKIEVRSRNITRGENSTVVASLPGDQSEFYILDVKDSDTYSIGIRFSNGLGAQSEWLDAEHTVIGKTAPPSIVSSLTAKATQLGIEFSWPAIPDSDLSHYVLAYSDDRENQLLYSEDGKQSAWVKSGASNGIDPTYFEELSDLGTLIAYFDASDLTSMYDATSGGSQVAVGGTVARWQDKSGNARHATQSTSGSRPILTKHPVGGVRNLWHAPSEPLSGTGYTNTDNITFQAGSAIPDAESEMVFGDNSVNRRLRYASSVVNGTNYVMSFYVKMDDGSVPNSGAGTYKDFTLLINNSDINSGMNYEHVGGNVYRVTRAFTANSFPNLGIWKYAGLNSVKTFKVSKMSVELGSTATAYQKTKSAYDITESGVANRYGLTFDGTADHLIADAVAPLLTGDRTPFSIFCVMKPRVNTNAMAPWMAGSSSNAFPMDYSYINTSTNRWENYRRNDGTPSSISETLAYATPLDLNLINLGKIYKGSANKIYKNGDYVNANLSSNTGISTLNWFTIGAFRRSGSLQNYFDGQIYALVIFDTSLTEADSLLVNEYLAELVQTTAIPLPILAEYAADGASRAQRLCEDESNATHYMEQLNLDVVSGERYRYFGHFLKAERKYIAMQLGPTGFSGSPKIVVNIEDGTVYSQTTDVVDVDIISYNDDWFRVEMVAQATSTETAAKARVSILNDSAQETYVGSYKNGIYWWGLAFQSAEANGKYKKTLAAPSVSAVPTVIASRVDVTNFVWGIQEAGEYDVNIRAVDTTGNESTTYTSVTVEVSAPGKPSNLAGQIVGADLLLTWGEPVSTQFTVEQYQVKDGAVILDQVKGNTYRQLAAWSGVNTFTVAAVDIKGNVGDTETVEVTINPPSAVRNLRSVVVDNNVLLYFDEPSIHTLPIKNYSIRKGATFGAATEVGQSTVGFINLFETIGGAYKYWVVPEDTGGNVGTETSLDVTVSQPPDFILYSEAVIDPADYDTFTNAIITEEATGFYAPCVTGRTFAQHFTDNSNTTFQDFITDGYGSFITPATLSDAVVERKIDLGVELPSSLITMNISETIIDGPGMTITPEISYSDDDVTYTSGGSGNSTVLGTNFRYIKLKYTIEAPDDKAMSIFTNHNYKVQVKKQTDSGIIEVTSNPTAFTFNLNFVDVTAIIATPQGTTALIAMIDFTDAPNPTGGNIYLFDTSGANASGAGKYVRWIAEGAVAPI